VTFSADLLRPNHKTISPENDGNNIFSLGIVMALMLSSYLIPLLELPEH
jgi:hypothetical protein